MQHEAEDPMEDGTAQFTALAEFLAEVMTPIIRASPAGLQAIRHLHALNAWEGSTQEHPVPAAKAELAQKLLERLGEIDEA